MVIFFYYLTQTQHYSAISAATILTLPVSISRRTACTSLKKERKKVGTKERELVNSHVIRLLRIGALLLTAVETFKNTTERKSEGCAHSGDDISAFLTENLPHLLRRSFTIRR